MCACGVLISNGDMGARLLLQAFAIYPTWRKVTTYNAKVRLRLACLRSLPLGLIIIIPQPGTTPFSQLGQSEGLLPRNGFLGPLRPGLLLLLSFGRGHVTFVREHIFGHYSWNFHSVQ